MGGTSFDVSLIAEGPGALAPQTSIDFGMVVRTPMIEITTIGAGGGSIAWVDKGGLLNIGPESAGSDPGPVAYGQGNDRPTVTDANVVLGRIDADRPIGGKLDGWTSTPPRAPSRPMWARSAGPHADRGGRGHPDASPIRAWPARSGWSVDRARLRPQALRLHALRRRRRAAYRRADARGRDRPGHRAALSRRDLGAWAA
jgi:hypothetical protein